MSRRAKRNTPAIEPMEEPTTAQLAKGGYERQFVTHVETNTKAMAYVSGHDPVKRWAADGRLSDTQLTAIALCRRLWDIAGISQPVTAHYGERVSGRGNSEVRNNAEIEARRDLHRIQDYFRGLEKWFAVFELVCRHGEAAGVAGSSLGYGGRAASERAHTVVCFIADKIAEQERL